MSGKGKGRYQKIKDRAIASLNNDSSTMQLTSNTAAGKDAKPVGKFSLLEIAKFTNQSSTQATVDKRAGEKDNQQALIDRHAAWKKEHNEKITALALEIKTILEAEKDRLLLSRGVTAAELQTDKVSFDVMTRWRELDSIASALERRAERRLKERMASYEEYKQDIKPFLKKTLEQSNNLDKYQDECCTKFAIKVSNIIWGLCILPGFFKLCKTGSYFFSAVGKSKEAVEQAYEVSKDKPTCCCG